MYCEALVFGIVDSPSPGGDPALGRKLRDLTISWSRYDYRGRILESTNIEDLLEQAAGLGYRWCLVQRSGHIILEHWAADDGRKRFEQCVSEWIGERDFLALGAVVVGDGQGERLDDQCLLVDVHRWLELGRPALAEQSSANGLPVHDIGPALEGRRVSLGRLSQEDARLLARYLGDGIHGYANGERWLDPEAGAFVEQVRRQVINAGRGVFLWNLEPYDDVRTPPHGFEPPITTLYGVASGFKPNMILESLGFDANTRVVFFDCSRRALEASASCSRSGTDTISPRSSRTSSASCRLTLRTTTCGTGRRRRRSSRERSSEPGSGSSSCGVASRRSRSTGRATGCCVTSSFAATSWAMPRRCSSGSRPSRTP